jgi:hypothetical protein
MKVAEHASPITLHQRTTEVIVKSWIIESRERRRAVLNRLYNSVWREKIEKGQIRG